MVMKPEERPYRVQVMESEDWAPGEFYAIGRCKFNVALNYGRKPVALEREGRKQDTINRVRGQATKCVSLRMLQVSPGLGYKSYPV